MGLGKSSTISRVESFSGDLQIGFDCRVRYHLLCGAATWKRGLVNIFLKVLFACLGNRTAAELELSEKIFTKPLLQVAAILSTDLTAIPDAGDDDERLALAALDPELALVVVGAAVGAADPLVRCRVRMRGAGGGALAPPAHAHRVVQVARQVGASG